METFGQINNTHIFESETDSYPQNIYRIWAIEGITGLKDLEHVFDNAMGYTEVELIVNFLNRKYNLANGDEDVYDFIVNILQFSNRALNIIEVNYRDFFEHMTTEEACFIILTKLIDHSGNIPHKNGFPANFNLDRSQFNKIITDEDDNKFYMCINNDITFNFNRMLVWLLNKWNFNGENSTCFMHGTSWVHSFSILNEGIKSIERISDFGKRNFYVTDTFLTSLKWAKRNQQSAIVLFFIPNEFLSSLKERLNFENLEELDTWKQLVFKTRNPPSFSSIHHERASIIRSKIIDYNNFMTELDSNELINGPIFANPGTDSVENVQYIQNSNGYIPQQYAFKERTYSNISSFIGGTILFQSFT
jgi:hypothetical protein